MARTNTREERPLLPKQQSRHGTTGYIGDVRTFDPAPTRQAEREKAKAEREKAKAKNVAPVGSTPAKDSAPAKPSGRSSGAKRTAKAAPEDKKAAPAENKAAGDTAADGDKDES